VSKSKIRATILDIPAIDRYEIIKSAISRFNTAIEDRQALQNQINSK